jgi:hypothetical protein
MTFEEFLSFGHRWSRSVIAGWGEAAKSYGLKFSRATVLARYAEELGRLVRGTRTRPLAMVAVCKDRRSED